MKDYIQKKLHKWDSHYVREDYRKERINIKNTLKKIMKEEIDADDTVFNVKFNSFYHWG